MTYTGYAPTTHPDIRKANERAAIVAILADDPTNKYWLNRLATLELAALDAYAADLRECRDAWNLERFCQLDESKQNAEHIGSGVWYDGFNAEPYIITTQAFRIAAGIFAAQIVAHL